ncbi:MAG: hypothetical protein L7S62_05175, partial [Flavobacteriales bacterium]|nr:hypothetical protein [Flavobacteriales bacterium]
PYSEETSRIIDEEVGKLIEGAYQRAKDILQTNFDKLNGLAESLLQNEVIFREDVQRILGERPFGKPAESEAKAAVTETEAEAGAKDAVAEDTGAADASAADASAADANAADTSTADDAAAEMPSS